MTLTEFLLAQIAEDEDEARHPDAVPAPRGFWDDSRVLAECEAKRRIIELCAEVMGDEDPQTSLDEAGWISLAWELMYELAAVYADHPDFREEWRA